MQYREVCRVIPYCRKIERGGEYGWPMKQFSWPSAVIMPFDRVANSAHSFYSISRVMEPVCTDGLDVRADDLLCKNNTVCRRRIMPFSAPENSSSNGDIPGGDI